MKSQFSLNLGEYILIIEDKRLLPLSVNFFLFIHILMFVINTLLETTVYLIYFHLHSKS